MEQPLLVNSYSPAADNSTSRSNSLIAGNSSEISPDQLAANELLDYDFLQSIRAPAVLRTVNPQAFTPLTVAVGPLHRYLCINSDSVDGSAAAAAAKSVHYSAASARSHNSFAEMERYKDIAVRAVLGVSDPEKSTAYADLIRETGIYSTPIVLTVPAADDEDFRQKSSPAFRIRRFYSFGKDVNLETPVVDDSAQPPLLDLQSVLIRDSCFLVEMMRCLSNANSSRASAGDLPRDFAWAFRRMGYPTRKAVLLDLLLLENQLPLFLVKRIMAIHEGSEEAAEERLREMVKAIAPGVLPFCKDAATDEHSTVVATAVSKAEHLLDCLYNIATAETAGSRSHDHRTIHIVDFNGNSSSLLQDIEQVMRTTTERAWPSVVRRRKTKTPAKNNAFTVVPTATELQLAGIEFHGHGRSLCEVSLKGNTLTIPAVHVGDETEKIFRNLLAHETRSLDADAVVMLSYLHFMNSLINTADDVALLAKSGVLTESMGDYAGVAQMWNRLTANTPCVYTKDYNDAATKAREYVENSFHVFMYEFRQEYLSRPWLVVSLFSGTALLVMTFVIMFYTILLYQKEG